MKSKIKEITFSMKKGMPNFSSVSAGVTYSVEDGDNVADVFAEARQVVQDECVGEKDPDWISNDTDEIKETKRIAEEKAQLVMKLNKKPTGGELNE